MKSETRDNTLALGHVGAGRMSAVLRGPADAEPPTVLDDDDEQTAIADAEYEHHAQAYNCEGDD